ncbi:MAG: T9SS type A sorting domain-containing protein [Bacteroidetes bacterium]|nr:T9SS type A sorting domain-containing protein [Bacteroidota bacterium]
MKLKSTIQTAALFFMSLGAAQQSQAQIVNGGFENWTKLNRLETPNAWTSLNLLAEFGGDSANCVKSKDAHWGKYAAQLNPSYFVIAGDTLPGLLTAKFTLNNRPAGVRFYYKGMPVGTDSAIVVVELYKGNTDSTDNLIADLNWVSGSKVSAYTLIQEDFQYYDSRTPDTAVVTIVMGGDATSFLKSKMLIDDIGFSAYPADVAADVPALKHHLYPNPSNGKVFISGYQQSGRTELFDLNGRKVLSIPAGASTADLSALENGIYLYRIETPAGLVSGKITLVK